nr:putative phospholipid hydroperoxide glutathione peroxidase [Quercus suber]
MLVLWWSLSLDKLLVWESEEAGAVLVDVNGNNAAPLYKFLKSSKGGIFGDSIKWNFSKFLVDKDGNVIDRYAPTTSPLSIEKDVKKALGIA